MVAAVAREEGRRLHIVVVLGGRRLIDRLRMVGVVVLLEATTGEGRRRLTEHLHMGVEAITPRRTAATHLVVARVISTITIMLPRNPSHLLPVAAVVVVTPLDLLLRVAVGVALLRNLPRLVAVAAAADTTIALQLHHPLIQPHPHPLPQATLQPQAHPPSQATPQPQTHPPPQLILQPQTHNLP